MTMSKLAYEYNRNVYELDRELVDEWMDREGITKDQPQFDNAMKCVAANAEGRLKLQGKPVTKNAMEVAMEDVIKEEIRLTGGNI